MKRLAFGAAVAAIVAAAVMDAAGTAAAIPTGGSSAAETVKALQEMGYNVQINGEVVGPLSQCMVTGVHGLTNTASTTFDTAYVDVSCPSGND